MSEQTEDIKELQNVNLQLFIVIPLGERVIKTTNTNQLC